MNYLFMGSLIEREKKFTGDKQIKAIVEKLLNGGKGREMKRMFSFEEFQEYVMDHIREYLPEEYANAEVSVRTVQKLNGVTLQGLEIWTPEMKQGTGVTPTIYLNGIYENYENGVDLEVIMEHIGNLERQSMDLPEDVAEIKEMYKDVNYVKDRLIVSLISAERNVNFLKDKPYRMLEDLAIFYKVLISKDANGTGTITVTNNHMEYWGLTEEQLYETAIKNSNVLEPPSIDRLTNVMADLMRAQGMDEDIIENQLKEDDIDMYVISNTTKANGASVIVYSDALQQVAENLGSDLYILPSSIHEVLALPVGNKDVDSLEEMVRCVNQTEVSPTEVLSDNVYKYDAESRTLSLASAKAETVKETAVCEPSGYTGTVNEVARPRHHR